MNVLKILKQFILDIIFPIACLGCQREGVWLCDDCLKKISLKTYDEKINKSSPLDGLFYATPYENKIIQEAIHTLKYKYIETLAHSLGELLTSYLLKLDTSVTSSINSGSLSSSLSDEVQASFRPELKAEGRAEGSVNPERNNESIPRCLLSGSRGVDKKEHLAILESPKNTLLIPVPLHKKRFLERGFNQAELIAKEFNKNFHFNLQTKILVRAKWTMPQVKLKGRQRKENIKGVFMVKNWNFSGKNVIILDDVATTLATLEECAKVLKQTGAQKVWGLVVAHGG